MSALDHITIRGFKSIAAIEKLALGPINVLIGPNGSGKSNFIEVFSLLHSIREGHLQEYVTLANGANRLLHFGAKTTPKMQIEISFENDLNGYSLDLLATDDDRLYSSGERVSFWPDKENADRPYVDSLYARDREAGISDPECHGVAKYVRGHLASWRVYHFHDTSRHAPMKNTADLHDNYFLRPDGANLAAFLYLLREKYADSYGLIRRTVQRVAPFFDDFNLRPQQLNPDGILLEWRHKNSEEYFNASSLSDGTLRFIALATLLLQPEPYRPSVILVDEPELGLHPLAIAVLASAIRSAAAKTQIIVSTQSSLLLDQFDPPEVLVAEREAGGTQLHRLEADRLEDWLKEYSLGQLWEKNVLGGRPVRD